MLLLLTSTTVPVVTGFSPPSGDVGTVIRVVGSGFIGAQSASVGGVTATYEIESNTVALVTVPSGATSGVVAVGGAESATEFTVTDPPVDLGGAADGQLLQRVAGAIAGLNVGAGLEIVGGALRAINLLGLFNNWTKNQRVTPVALTSATTITVDVQDSQGFTLALTHDATISFSNVQAGMGWRIQVSASANQTLSWTGVTWAGNNPLPSTIQAGKKYRVMFDCLVAGEILGAFVEVP